MQLTDTASRLAELQAKVTEMEGVDFERVQEIREQIVDGTYSIDADRVANAFNHGKRATLTMLNAVVRG